VECGLNQLWLGFPKFSLAHHQASAEKQTDPLDCKTLLVVLPVSPNDVLGILGMVDDIDVAAERPGFEDVAKRSR
jgi:hypothetical protein